MEKIKLQVSGSQIQVIARPAAITAGTVGLEAEFSFDSHWDNLAKTVIFRAGDTVITAALERDTHIVPWEVLEKPDLWLIVGVYGANPEGTVVIPTLWTKVAAVYTGVDPEGDPALKPSNPIWQETLARVANMEPQLQEHINDMNNPHGITCDQIGAVTQKEFRDVVSNLDSSSDSDELIPHLLNRDNPHGVTAAQAGAAPAGYGYGGEIPGLIEVDSDDALKTALDGLLVNMPDYSARNVRVIHNGASVVNGVGTMGGQGTLYGSLYKHSADYAILRVFGYLGASFSLVKLGTWGEVEWVNPPLAVGVEYRTTERYMGKPVYVKAVSLGNLPNAGFKQVRYTNATASSTNMLSIRGCAINESGRPQPLPLDYNGQLIEMHVNSEFVFLRTIADNSAWTAVAVVKYTLD